MNGNDSNISATVLADSINACNGRRLTTFLLKYPRFVHAEMLTHRVFARNSASSRAIPVKTMLWNIWTNPAMPIRWGRTKKGMQDGGTLSKTATSVCKALWLMARYPAMLMAWLLVRAKLHKQVANRLLEPWSHMTVVLTGTEWVNFYRLRYHKDAQPEFQALAQAMLEAHADSKPRMLQEGEWHLPFVSQETFVGEYKWLEYPCNANERTEFLLKRCTARCARTSYVNFYGKNSVDDDIRLHDDLGKAGHWSPFEHPCQAMKDDRFFGHTRGFKPYRKTFVNETHDGNSFFDPKALLLEIAT